MRTSFRGQCNNNIITDEGVQMMKQNRRGLVFVFITVIIGITVFIYFGKVLRNGVSNIECETEKNAVDEVFRFQTDEINQDAEQKTESIFEIFLEKRLEVPYLSQEDKYPTGCESVSAVMLLNYFEYDISVDTFIDLYLEKQDYYWKNGVFYAPHPDKAFIGDPRNSNSYGCYAPVIVNALNKYLLGSMEAVNLTGTSIENLIGTYINNDIPVLFWASMNMKQTQKGTTWNISENETFDWIAGEHCLVFIGYDEDNYYFNDPYQSNGIVGYEKELVDKRFNELGNQAVAIINRKQTTSN